ncbi:flavodoxin family protein [Methanolobus profundi]|uniref:Multimeric flavodoxin WrbA n=1 Tax=Methanolobus profundi TaxID=487685 RepID=A0A1I4QVJ0_9EURY|nr:flavodoxin family protein [Methanolobus profundi]SFM43713.1 Multimeric flavodoxin WrbA [Methanolobus profundi]
MKVIGISGSPIPESNTDRALKAALDATGLETEFIKLSEYTIKPCLACLKCVNTNVCIIGDDGNVIAEKVKDADALIVAGYTPYSSIDSGTKAMLERLYAIRHKKGYMRGKPGGIIITSAVPCMPEAPPVAETAVNAVAAYMQEEGMEVVGDVKILGNVPCVSCGYGDECELSGISMIYGPDATVDSVGINKIEDQDLSFEGAKQLGKNIAGFLNSKE